jgi:hypothetical protein
MLGHSAWYTCRRWQVTRGVAQAKGCSEKGFAVLTSWTPLQITCLRRSDTPLWWTSKTPFRALQMTTARSALIATQHGADRPALTWICTAATSRDAAGHATTSRVRSSTRPVDWRLRAPAVGGPSAPRCRLAEFGGASGVSEQPPGGCPGEHPSSDRGYVCGILARPPSRAFRGGVCGSIRPASDGRSPYRFAEAATRPQPRGRHLGARPRRA